MDLWSLTRHHAIMTWPLGRISNALILLAATLSPLQQAWAATSCCCSGNSDTSRDISVASHGDCCSQGPSSGCCGLDESTGQSCCQNGPPNSVSAACCCPVDCAQNDSPRAVDPANIQASSDDELIGSEIASRSSIAADHAPDALLGNASLALSSPASGVALCVLLCCYRL